MHRDSRPPVATLRRSAQRHRDLHYQLTDRSDIDEFTVAILRGARASTAATSPAATPTAASWCSSASGSTPVDIVNLGATVWPVVVENRPVDDAASTWANAVPAASGNSDGFDHSGLQPNRVQWHLHRTSQYGTTMIDAAVRLRWTFGATYRGRGAYIPRLWVDVPVCHVEWGVQLGLAVHVLPCRNVADAGDPVAGLPVGIVGSVVTPLGKETLAWRLAVRGDGSTSGWFSDER